MLHVLNFLAFIALCFYMVCSYKKTCSTRDTYSFSFFEPSEGDSHENHFSDYRY